MWANRRQVEQLSRQVSDVERQLRGLEHTTGVLLEVLDELRRLENRLRMRDVRAKITNGNGAEGHPPDEGDRALLRHKGLFPGG